MLTLLHVDDVWNSPQDGFVPLREYYEGWLSIAMGPSDRVWLANVVLFAQAHKAVRWIESGCWLDKSGNPACEKTSGAKPCPPDVAFVDIDFDKATEAVDLEEWWSGPSMEPDQTSYRVGWAVASMLKQEVKTCELVLYTGKPDVEDDLREAAEHLRLGALTLPPFIRVEDKVTTTERMRGIVEGAFAKVREKLIKQGKISTECVSMFEQYCCPLRERAFYSQLSGQKRGPDIQYWLLHSFRPLAELFPAEFHSIMRAMSGDEADIECGQLAADAVYSQCVSVERHIPLLRQFKKVQIHLAAADHVLVGGFVTPTAAIRHNIAWEDASNGFVSESGRRLSKLTDEEKLGQKQVVNDWCSVEGNLDESVRRAINDRDPYEWFEDLRVRDNPAIKDWESDFRFWLDKLPGHFNRHMRVEICELPKGVFLTDWRGLFGGVDSAFGLFLSDEEDEKHVSAVHICGEVKEDNVLLVFKLLLYDGTRHCGSPEGFFGTTHDATLKGWGQSWYEVSVEPESAQSLNAEVWRHGIWPSGGHTMCRFTPRTEPVFELHWLMPDVLRRRAV